MIHPDRTVLDELPRQIARTQRFSLGVPRQFRVADDGSRVLYLRTRGGEDRVSCLWVLDAAGERLLVDPEGLGGEGVVPDAEQARRERVRERSSGVVSYSTDRTATTAVFALGGNLWTASVDGAVRSLASSGLPMDPRIDPDGRRVAYVSDGALHVVDLATGGPGMALRSPEGPDVTYGLAEHVAAEEIHRVRGHWWSPDGSTLLVARVDNGPVRRWWISDPSDPSATPRQVPYPVAGTANARVSLWMVGLNGDATEVVWDRAVFEYLVSAAWDRHGPLLSVQSRDQRTLHTLAVDPGSGTTSLLREDTDPLWVHIVPGTPARTESGRLVSVSDVAGARRLVVDGAAASQPELHVHEVLEVRGETIWFVASTDPTEQHVWAHVVDGGTERISDQPGLHRATVGGETTVLHSFTEGGHQITVTGPVLGEARIRSLEASPLLEPAVQWLSIGPRALRTALLLPHAHVPGSRRLPVLMCPYAGPAGQRVTRARHWHFVEAQWFAEHGFAVVVADGSGTPGRGPAWEHEIYGDVLTPVIADQVAALGGAAAHCPDLDLSRVAMRGWSYGGMLSLACVLRRPDAFLAAVAGAAPTDMRLYDTHYRERYLGHPDAHPEHYARCSLVHEAPSLTRPLLMVHGMADDNVVVANALRMSAALLAAGKQHEMLLLPAATHMARDPEVSANLLVHELRFLCRSLGMAE